MSVAAQVFIYRQTITGPIFVPVCNSAFAVVQSDGEAMRCGGRYDINFGVVVLSFVLCLFVCVDSKLLCLSPVGTTG